MKRDATEEEIRLWRSAMRHVRPLPGARPQPVTEPGHARRMGPTTKTAETRPVSPKHSKTAGLATSRPATPEDRSGEKRVRRGRIPVTASFDLHGHSQDTAWRTLPQFLSREQARGARCVIVITGKGRSGEGVLRRNFLKWLELPEAARLVSGYAQAHSRHGGSGAWYVFLRRPVEAR